MLYETPPPYFIVLASSLKTMEVKAIEVHRIATVIPRVQYLLFNPLTAGAEYIRVFIFY